MPLEVQLLVDLDHLWSFTHENFWQDTVRKGVEAKIYLKNLEQDLDSYFVTNAGKQKARELLAISGFLMERSLQWFSSWQSPTHCFEAMSTQLL